MKVLIACASLVMAASYAFARPGIGGQKRMPVKYYGTASSTTTGSNALVFSINGLKANDACVVSAVTWGTGPARLVRAVATANTLTVHTDSNQTSGTSTVAYICFKP